MMQEDLRGKIKTIVVIFVLPVLKTLQKYRLGLYLKFIQMGKDIE